ncbi:ATP-dependent helicase [Nesterenkonia sp. MY13]|uniref:DNA 3'-5' helicase n=1 Tax=Nesterenkonia sedimenti TaxID=1463632 RepID=A0A7X8TIB0_9MICC|nr:ATP-dependent DNA helicase [Nesterenkonia sedimenti]NLS09276.1 ATP-dependent helicase [Nesterenkonia sedimenti]
MSAGQHPRYSSTEIAQALGNPPPTPEQRKVIEAPLEPTLVIAGAGSGKTATMADRVVYLVANAIIRPDEILGVTFTRKAAGELRERVTGKLAHLLRAGLITAETLLPAESEDTGPATAQLDPAALLAPVISTYHAYAQSLVTEYGMHIGLEPETQLIGEAQAWQIVAPLVESFEEGHTFVETGATVSSLPGQVLTLAGDCAEHLRNPADVVGFLQTEIERAERLRDLKFAEHEAKEQKKLAKDPDYQPKPPKLGQKEQALLDLLKTRQALPGLVTKYHQAKAELGVMDFGDLLRHAVRIVQEAPQAVEAEREKYRLVLLDEFQDTSYAQLELFAQLYGAGTEKAVTAVGDPNQSIYGFRGASAGQLFSFPHRFPRTENDDATPRYRPAPIRQLTVAWRNGRSILATANAIVAPLSRDADNPWDASTAKLRGELKPLITPDQADKDPEQPLSSGGEPILPPEKVAAGEVHYGFFHTEAEETEAIIAQLRQVVNTDEGTAKPTEEQPSCAVLAPTHGRLAAIAEGLRAAGVHYQLLSLQGLLHVPEVAETISYLRVLNDPGRSDALMRILAGARYRIGPRDLHRLGAYASSLAGRRRPSAGEEPLTTAEADTAELQSLAEALAALPEDTQRLTESLGFSTEGAQRLLGAKQDFATLRRLIGLDLGTLIHRLVQETGLDVEVAARPVSEDTGPTDSAGAQPAAHPTAQLDALIGYAQSFAEGEDPTDLTGFLDWLDAAAANERGLEQAAQEPAPGAVQLLTVHASKGLEWDVVAVAGLREDLFPAARARAQNWLNAQANLPWPLRGDHAALPQWDSDQESISFWVCSSGRNSTKAYENTGGRVFSEDCYAFSRQEQRRLAYVALTRARSRLICTGASFYGASGGKEASEFLSDIRQAAQETNQPESFTELNWYEFDPEDQPENPEAGLLTEAQWPYDPLAAVPMRRVRLERADTEDPTSVDEYHPVADEQPQQLPTRRPAMTAAAQAVREAAAENVVVDSEAQQESPRRGWLAQAQAVIRRHQLARRDRGGTELPAQMSASTVVALAQDPQPVLEQVRRPVPQRPHRQARRGTVVHAWVEQQFDAVAPFPEIDDAVSTEKDLEQLFDLATVKENFRSTPWAQRQVFAMEIPVETSVEGVMLRGRIDAVFGSDPQGRQLGTGDFERWEQLPKLERNAKMAQCSWDLVDWKTGSVPTGADLEAKQLQLAIYRLAFSRIYGVPAEQINAHFVYLDAGRTLTPQRLQSAEELQELIRGVRPSGRPVWSA